jgi:mRNA deadenylase 3'-5' endonuclease subunit Ccr4
MLKGRALGIAGLAAAAGAVAIINRTLVSSSKSLAVKVIPRGTKLGGKQNQVSIVSYNVLCDKFSTSQKLPNVAAPFLSFDYRWQLLARELSEFDADIICIQEAPIDRWDDLKNYMANLGYDCLVQQKPHEVKLAVFWRCGAISLAWSEERSRALLTELNISSDLTTTDDNSSTTSTESTLFVINVHLEGSPYRASDRVAQLRHALQRLAHHLETTGRSVSTAKVIILGDFNSIPTDAPSKFLKEGKLEAGYTDPFPENQPHPATDHDIFHNFKLHDVYEEAKAAPPFTRKVGARSGARLDLIWATLGCLEVEAVMRPLPLEHRELVERVGLPNYALPSDHLPVGAVFLLQEEDSNEEDSNGVGEKQQNRVSVDSSVGTVSSESEDPSVKLENGGGAANATAQQR